MNEQEREAAHEIIDHAESVARFLRMMTHGRLSVAVVENHGNTWGEVGMDWPDAHRAVDRIAREGDGK